MRLFKVDVCGGWEKATGRGGGKLWPAFISNIFWARVGRHMHLKLHSTSTNA